ncbi:MAG: NAD-dependent epimerase/dehydratase family protein [Bacteroidota bacterium]
MTALVTGATGFIGSHLVELLLHKGYTVRCLIRKSSDTKWLERKQVEYVYGDLFSEEALAEAVRGVDYVFHSAGVTKAKTKEEYYAGNATGTKNILAATAAHNRTLKRFVHISSQAAVGPSTTQTPINEDEPSHPLTTYGKSKWQAEEECLKMMKALPITICRPPAVYGPRDKDVFEFFNTMSKGLQPMVGFNEKLVSLVHVSDLVRGFVMAAESSKAVGQTYFIASNGVYGWKEIGEVTRKVMNKSALRIRLPEFAVYIIATFAEFFSLFSSKPALINFEKARDMVQDYWTCDSSKAKRDFGYEQQISLEDGIRGTVGWYKGNAWL